MRISLLIDSPLSRVLTLMRGADGDVRRNIARYTKAEALPIWRDELSGRGDTRLQSRLAQSGTVGVTQQNVFLRTGAGKLSSGTALSELAWAAEVGATASREVATRSRTGTPYKRKLGPMFGPIIRKGRVTLPAARESVTRFASLWAQVAARTLHELIEKA